MLQNDSYFCKSVSTIYEVCGYDHTLSPQDASESLVATLVIIKCVSPSRCNWCIFTHRTHFYTNSDRVSFQYPGLRALKQAPLPVLRNLYMLITSNPTAAGHKHQVSDHRQPYVQSQLMLTNKHNDGK